MTELTPVDILNKKFNHKVRGYDTNEVDEFVRQTAAALERYITENVLLKQRVEGLEAEMKHFRDTEASLNNTLVLAQKTADDLKSNAEKEAELIVRDAKERLQREMQSARQEMEEIQRLRNRFEIEFRALLRSYLDLCEGGQVGSGTARGVTESRTE